ncbi:hypothetical protein F8606_21690 [Salmonella enterica]|nr:hypothetical protein [Salmonella enterica]EEG5325029.1 hypothetical protein [Salmonella enterica]EFQ5899216.1 hypothetical protein [Salmonella enterica]EGG5310919.1 hypothetical protein [Salmonella enterica]EHE6023427.1 hypothetical protein [Salmonella enterica]
MSNNLINKVMVTETGLTLCKPDIYSLDIGEDENGDRTLRISRMGNELISFHLDDIAVKALIRKLMP